MSNLSINTTVPMNTDYRPLDREQVVNKSRDNQTLNVLSTTVIRNNDLGPKDSNVTVSKDALEKLFEMFDFAFKAIRSMLAAQGATQAGA